MAKAPLPEQVSSRRSRPTQAQGDDLSEQIAEIRALMARVIELTVEVDDFKALVGLLDKYSQASTRLVTLMKAQRSLTGEQDLAQALHQALAEVLEEESVREP